MKVNIKEVKYNVLEELNFTIDDYSCECYCMDWKESDNYSLRICNSKGEEVYSCWFDSTLGSVAGNEEQYTDEDISVILEQAYNTISEYIKEF